MTVDLIVFSLAGLLVLICFLSPLASAMRIPSTLLLLLAGSVLGYLSHVHDWAPGWLGDALESLQAFEIPSETILVIFLPILLFETALNTNVRGLINDLGPILLLAVIAVVICTAFVGLGVSLISGYGLAVCLLLGAIIATTDPAAVVSIFKEVGAPKRLTTIVEGESLLNDAAAIALFSVLIGLASHTSSGTFSIGGVAGSFLVLLIGGAISGYVIGRMACVALPALRGWPTAEISLTIATAYLAYIIPEHFLGLSGVVSTVVAGLVVSSVGRTRMTQTTSYALAQSWRQFGFLATSLIFLFAALTIPRMLAHASWHDLLVVIMAMLAALLARAITVYGLLPLVTATAGTQVDQRYKAVICWGGLRGALSLALALAVTEHEMLSDEISNFIAVGVTGFVLATLLLNGMTLRPLIRLLDLNTLSPLEQAMRNQAVVVTVNDLQAETDRIALDERISRQARQRISQVFEGSIENITDRHIEQFEPGDRLRLGLSVLAQRQSEFILVGLGEQGFDRRTAERLLSISERMEDDVKVDGMAGFDKSIRRALRYSARFKIVMRLQRVFGFHGWLGRELGQRFVELVGWRWVTRRLIAFTAKHIQPMLGDETALAIEDGLRKRLARIEDNMQALRLQYPHYAEWLEQSYLGRLARTLERSRYRKMLEESIISPEVYDSLLAQLDERWAFLEKPPPIDIELSPSTLVHKVPLLADLPDEILARLTQKLRSRLALPGQLIQGPGKTTPALYFVASGAVSMLLPDATHVELGSGEFFGELLLIDETTPDVEVRSLGYTRLLELTARDFKVLLEKDAQLRQAIEVVAKQRHHALQVGNAEAVSRASAPTSSGQ